MKLKQKLPPNRSFEKILNHYLVEKSIAEKLKKSNQEERKLIYATMYDELFSKVPDHSRLVRRRSSHLSLKANKRKYTVVKNHLHKSSVFVEFAPGDCRFSFKIAEQVRHVYGVDISNQCNPSDSIPNNFKLIVYDGFNLPEDFDMNSVDVAFSDQLIEHLHPEDTKLHFELVCRILKSDGKYIFRTPHLLTGPHDISKYFCDEPECFHLKEWTFVEIRRMILESGYSRFHCYWNTNRINARMPFIYFAFIEFFINKFPRKYLRVPNKYLLPSLCGVAIK